MTGTTSWKVFEFYSNCWEAIGGFEVGAGKDRSLIDSCLGEMADGKASQGNQKPVHKSPFWSKLITLF